MKAQCVDSNQGTFHVDRVKTNYSRTGFSAGLHGSTTFLFDCLITLYPTYAVKSDSSLSHLKTKMGGAKMAVERGLAEKIRGGSDRGTRFRLL